MPIVDLPCCKSSRLVEPDFCRLVSHCLIDKVLNAELNFNLVGFTLVLCAYAI